MASNCPISASQAIWSFSSNGTLYFSMEVPGKELEMFNLSLIFGLIVGALLYRFVLYRMKHVDAILVISFIVLVLYVMYF